MNRKDDAGSHIISKKISRIFTACIVVSCIVLFLFTKTVSAQMALNKPTYDKYRPVLWSVDDGLGQERWHTSMLKDADGFLWVGSTYGELSRFDGNSFKQYENDNAKHGTIQGGNCLNFVEDSMHNIWIGLTTGLSRYDIKADTFTNFKGNTDTAIKEDYVLPFWATRDQVLCMEGGGWITEINVHSFIRKKLLNIEQIIQSGKIRKGLPSDAYAFFDAAANSVWILCHNEEGLAEISITTGKVIYHTRKPYKKPDGHHLTDAEAMVYDRKRNCLWINSHDGLTGFTLNDKQFHHVNALNFLANSKEYDRYVGIDIDPQGRIWFATTRGTIIYDPLVQTVTEPVSDSALQEEITFGNLKIYCDRDGITWMSYWSVKGIYELIPFTKIAHRYTAGSGKPDSLSSLDIPNMVAGPHGQLWIGTQKKGLNIFHPVTNSFTTLGEKLLPGIKGDGITPMVIDTLHKRAWLNAAPPDRVYEMDLKTYKCKQIIFKDTAGHVIEPVNIINFLSIPFNNGMLFYDAGHGIFEVPGKSTEALLIVPMQGITTNLIIGKDNKLFINRNLTYQYVNGKWQKIHSALDSLGWIDAYYNKTDDTYWVSTHNKIIHYNSDFHTIRVYTNEDGLIGDPFTILPDGLGNIWFNNDRKNISSLNIETGVITSLTIQDGYQKQSYDLTSPRGKIAGNELFFTGNHLAPNIGLDRISPDKFASAHSSVVYLKSLKINQNPMPYPLSLNDITKLSLRYFENNISIETGIINHFAKGKSRIRYRIEERDTSWQYAPYYYTIRYEELPPGKYTFRMQASNAANEFNGAIKTLFIQINPAFWNTWWFRILAVISLGLLFYGAIRWRLQQKFRLQLERSEKETQIAEIKQKATELEMQALRAQMNPHFIFNSLNSINRFILQNNKAQASEYLTKFSKLVRLILQNSQASLITLESELESLELYLNLEALRFNYHFEYTISVPKDMDIEVLKVPPLILQPYVENAIWHGLMHKEEKGHLDIRISEEAEHVYFKVIDDGIGRKKASELSSKSATKHKSMGLRITAHRIAMLQNSNGLESPVKINDLLHPDGSAAGTEVVIKMPVIYD